MSPRSRATRILIGEDSRTYAAALKRFLEHDPDLQVVGTSTTVADLVRQASALQPDLLLLDLELADGRGERAIERIVRSPGTPIVVLSDHAERGSARAAAALGAGAVDAQTKRSLPLRDPGSARAVLFRRQLKRLSRATPHPALPPARPARGHRATGRAAGAIGICASTGGPPALRTVLSVLPAKFPIPIFVVQHMTKGFIAALLEWFRQDVRLPVGIAAGGLDPGPGIWFAGDGAHLAFDRRCRTRLDTSRTAGYHCPAGDVLLASMAATFGAECAAVVMTGMGSDGAEGVAAVNAAGGLTIAQDARTSAIYGMPKAARERGAQLILPLEEIGAVLAGLTLPGAR